MQGFIGVMRIYLKHAAILFAVGALLQLAAFRSRANNAPKRPRITRIDHVSLYVTDPRKAAEFYTKLLGLPDRGSACDGVSRPCFAVDWGRKQAIELVLARSSKIKDFLAEIAFATDDVDQMHRYLTSRGVKCGSIAKESNGIWHFQVADPEGNLISFVQRTDASIDDPPFMNPVGDRLLHAGFVVKNRDAENRFYLDLLGFKLYWYGGFKDDGVDWYEIQVPDGSDWIEYMLNIPANADHKELGIQNHFSLGVKDIHAAADQLRKNGLAKFDGPEIGRDGKWALDAYDPDGTRVEFMEFTPAGKPCCHPYTAPHPQL